MRSLITISPTVNIVAKAIFTASGYLMRDFGEINNLQNSAKLESFVANAENRAYSIIAEELLNSYSDYSLIETAEEKSDGFFADRGRRTA